MKIKLGPTGYVDGYVTYGDMDGAEEYAGTIPEEFGPGTYLFYHMVNNELVYDAERAAAAQNATALLDEYYALYEWFAWYDNQVNQYERSKRMADPAVFDGDIKVLDDNAKANQVRIREIRGIINA